MITTLERAAVALPLVLAAVGTFAIGRRRIVFVLGRRGRWLAPVVCLALWLTGVTLGQLGGSLVLMAAGGALPLVVVALVAGRTRVIRVRGPRLGWPVAVALGAVMVYVAAVVGFDGVCHFAVLGQYLRGNIPPTALNDATAPLVYHPLFDAAAALFTRGLGLTLEQGLDFMSMIAVGACVCAAAALSSELQPSRAQPRPAGLRVVWLSVFCLLFAFGPTPLRLLWQAPAEVVDLLRGRTDQAFLEQVLRRPYALGFAVVASIIVQLIRLARVRRKATSVASSAADRVRALLLVPPFFLLPQLAEEQLLLLGGAVLLLLLVGRLSLGAAACAGVGAIGGLIQSGVFRGLFAPASMATPHLALAWPPLLPTWAEPLSGWPLLSRQALEVALLELGPIFCLATAVLLGRRSRAVVPDDRAPAARIVGALAIGNLVAACFLTLRGWPRADLDRFVFCASNLGWIAAPVLLPPRLLGARRPWPLVALAALVTAGSLPVAAHRLADQRGRPVESGAERPYAQLRRVLGARVGPRDLIATDRGSAQLLLTAGFLVVAPLDSHMVGIVNGTRFDRYLGENVCRARWLWVPETDPRAQADATALLHGGYALVVNHERCETGSQGLRRP